MFFDVPVPKDTSYENQCACYQKKKVVKNGMGNPVWRVTIPDIHLWPFLWMYCSGYADVNRNEKTARLADNSSHRKWLASREIIGSIEELETQPAGIKLKTSHYRSPEAEKHWQRHRSTIYLPWKDEKMAIFNQTTLELFQRQHWRKFWDGVQHIWAFPSA